MQPFQGLSVSGALPAPVLSTLFGPQELFFQARITSDSLFALPSTSLLTIVFSLILNCDWLSGLPGTTKQDRVNDSGQDSSLPAAQNFYSHPDSPRDQIFPTPTQGQVQVGPTSTSARVEFSASGLLPELRHKTKAAQSQVREPKEENRPGMVWQREWAA